MQVTVSIPLKVVLLKSDVSIDLIGLSTWHPYWNFMFIFLLRLLFLVCIRHARCYTFKKKYFFYGNHKALVCFGTKILPPAPDQFWVLQSVCAAVQHFFSLTADSLVVKTRDTSWRLGTGIKLPRWRSDSTRWFYHPFVFSCFFNPTGTFHCLHSECNTSLIGIFALFLLYLNNKKSPPKKSKVPQ